MSEGSPNRLRGTASKILDATSSLPISSFVMSVLMNPGATALTVMLRDANSRARDLVSPIIPALAAE